MLSWIPDRDLRDVSQPGRGSVDKNAVVFNVRCKVLCRLPNSIELNVARKIINRGENINIAVMVQFQIIWTFSRDVSQNRRLVHKDAIVFFNAVRFKA